MVFLIALFFIKNKTLFINKEIFTSQGINQDGLAYNTEIIGDLVNRDTDGDGVLDWEEGLWGTNPTKKDTNDDGVPDNIEIEKLKKAQGQSEQGQSLLKESGENLTETDKFSREFFSTVATLNQAGSIDQTTVDKLGSSLADHIQNTTPKKIFIISDIKTINNNTTPAIQNYANTLENTFKKHTINVSIPDILAESMTNDGDIDVAVLDKLDPIIKHIKGIVNEMMVMKVPSSISVLHLDALNRFQKLAENLSDIKLVDLDVIVAISAISQYQKNDEELRLSLEKFKSVINQKLNN